MKINRLLHSHRIFRMTQEQRAKNLSKLSGLSYQECLQRLEVRDYQWENDLIINASKKAESNLLNLLQEQALEKVKRKVSE